MHFKNCNQQVRKILSVFPLWHCRFIGFSVLDVTRAELKGLFETWSLSEVYAEYIRNWRKKPDLQMWYVKIRCYGRTTSQHSCMRLGVHIEHNPAKQKNSPLRCECIWNNWHIKHLPPPTMSFHPLLTSPPLPTIGTLVDVVWTHNQLPWCQMPFLGGWLSLVFALSLPRLTFELAGL